MKIAAFLLIAGSLIVGCKSPTSPASPAEAPTDGSVFTYSVASDFSTGQVTHTIRKTPDGFKATTSTGDEIDYKTYDNGDIVLNCSCSPLELGVATHRSFHSNAGETPTKYGGHEVQVYVKMDSKYLGNETVKVDTVAYDCSKIEVDYTFQPVDSAAITHLAGVTTYWYSPTLRYFTRIDTRSYYVDSVTNWSSSTLMSFN